MICMYASTKGRYPPGRRVVTLLSLLLILVTLFSAVTVSAADLESNGVGGGVAGATGTGTGSYGVLGDYESAAPTKFIEGVFNFATVSYLLAK